MDETLIWRQCTDASERPMWCLLERIETASITATQGVYVVWHGGDEPETVRVGQAFFQPLAETLEALRSDDEVLAFRANGLFVTWAEVADAHSLDGVERYLGDRLEPLVGRRLAAEPIEVNLPWGDE